MDNNPFSAYMAGGSGDTSGFQTHGTNNPFANYSISEEEKKRRKLQQQQNKQPKPQPQQTPPQNQFQNWVDQAKQFGGDIFNKVKDLVSEAPQVAKDVWEAGKPGHALPTIEGAAVGAGESVVTYSSAIVGGIESGVTSHFHIQLPDKYNFSKVSPGLQAIDNQFLKTENPDFQKAFNVGRWIGPNLINFLVGGAVGETVGGIGAGVAEKFLPQAAKFIPAVADAASWMGTPQIAYDPNTDGSRKDVLINSMLNFGFFKGSGKLVSLISKPLASTIDKALTKLGNKWANGESITIQQGENFVKNLDEKIKTETGQTSQQIVQSEIKKGDNSLLVEQPKETSTIDSSKLTSYENFDRQTVDQYKKLIQSGKETAPIMVSKDSSGKLGVEDGKNRLQAYKELGINNIPVVYKEGMDQQALNEYNNLTQADQTAISKLDQQVQEQVKPQSQVQQPLTPVGEGETKVSTLASKVEAQAVEKHLTASGFGNLPEYKTVNLKDQADKVATLMTKDMQQAINIAMGKEQPPAGILPEMVFTGVEKQALANGNVDLIRQLAQESTLSTQATAMGQRIRALGERDPMSPTVLMAQVAKDRADQVVSKTKSKSVTDALNTQVKNLQAEIDKVAPNKNSWKSFIDSIEC